MVLDFGAQVMLGFLGILLGLVALFSLTSIFRASDRDGDIGILNGGAKRKKGLKLKSNTLCCLLALVAGSLVILRLVRGEGLV